MDKKALVEEIVRQPESEHASLKAAALETYAAATGEESQPENEYDTRALEASYLAGAQTKRVLDLEAALTTLKFLELKSFGPKSRIEATALVKVDGGEKQSLVFIAPIRASLVVHIGGSTVQVITPQSPLGEALIGLAVGDIALVDKSNETLEYEVLGIE